MEPKKIIYRNITINDRNIDAFRTGKRIVMHGQCDIFSRKIYIYKYTLDANLKLPKNDQIRQECEQVNKEEPLIMVHELKHLKNADFAVESFAKSYYECVMLYCMDEVSARAAEYVSGHRINAKNVARSMRRAAEFFQDLDYYTSDFLPNIQENIVNDLKNHGRRGVYNLNQQNLLYLMDSPELYSEHFHKIERHYFTFGNFCIYDHLTDAIEKSLDWQRFIIAREQIRNANLLQLNTTINTILNLRRNKQLK